MRRLQIIAAALLALALAVPAVAQGRVTGLVQDMDGRAIKGASIRAVNPGMSTREWTSTTDDKGRFVILGLRVGANWQFVAESPGYVPSEATVLVRSVFGAPLTFTLRRDPGPIPGALTKGIQDDLSEANTLRNQGRYDQALAAYQSIQAKNPKLTTLNLVIANVYRQQAEQERDASARQALLDRAAAAELAGTSTPAELK